MLNALKLDDLPPHLHLSSQTVPRVISNVCYCRLRLLQQRGALLLLRWTQIE